MQNNDFDQRIRQMLEQNEPPFDPAHWDRMEDMLQQLPASPNAGNSAGSGSVAGSMGAGAKLLAVAAAVVVTGVNVAVYKYSTSDSDKATDKSEQKSTSQLTPPAVLQNIESLPETGEASKSNETGSSVETGATGLISSDSHSGTDTSVPSSGSVTVSPLNLSPGLPLSGSAPVINPFTPEESVASNFASPCGPGGKARIPNLVLHNDTIRNLQVDFNACEPQCLLVPPRNGATVTWSDAVNSLPGASFLINEQTGVGSLCWTPTAEQAKSESYTVQMGARDSRCPSASISFAISITVKASVAGQLVGDSVVKAGESAHLQLLQLPSGSSIRWRQAGGEWLTDQGTSLEVSPVASTVYQAQVTMPNGCSRLLSQKVRVENPDIRAFIPNIFTPDGDGINDRFVLKDIREGSTSLEVFDRWGKRVYANEHYTNNWDASGLTDGYYTYQITELNTGKVYKGGVSVSRNR